MFGLVRQSWRWSHFRCLRVIITHRRLWSVWSALDPAAASAAATARCDPAEDGRVLRRLSSRTPLRPCVEHGVGHRTPVEIVSSETCRASRSKRSRELLLIFDSFLHGSFSQQLVALAAVGEALRDGGILICSALASPVDERISRDGNTQLREERGSLSQEAPTSRLQVCDPMLQGLRAHAACLPLRQ